MPGIRRAHQEDTAQILKILDELDLYHPSRIPQDFWVAKKNDKIVGLSCLSDHGDFLFLSSVGVIPNQRNNGIAKAILKKILPDAKKDVYLYSIIPDFFKKLGFEIVDAPKDLPPKNGIGCDECHAAMCVCMRRKTCNANLM